MSTTTMSFPTLGVSVGSRFDNLQHCGLLEVHYHAVDVAPRDALAYV